ncbi:MAG: Gmad2 immunoglobulin-like domain-containing protein [Actinomycetota bacterium]
MSTEDRLRQAARHEVDGIDPPAGWTQIEERIEAAESRRRRQRVGLAAASLAAVVALVIGAIAVIDDDDTQGLDTLPADTTATTEPTTTTLPDTAPDTAPPPADQGIPDDAIYPRDGSTFDDPLEVVDGFATEYLGMPAPLEIGRFQQGDPQSGEVELRRQRTPALVTRVLVRRLGNDGHWYVIGATADNIRVDEPTAGALVSSPIPLRGAASAFEGNVNVHVRDDAGGADEVLGETFVTGNGGPELGPFEGSVDISGPTTPQGAVIFATYSMDDGTLQEATVVRVRFDVGTGEGAACRQPSPLSPTGEGRTVAVVFSCGRVPSDHPDFFVAVPRRLPETQGVLRAALEQLLAGPTDQEREGGLTSWFSEETADMLLGVTITADGTAVVDLDPALADAIPNASTSAGSMMLLGQLDGTVFHFANVQAVEYRLGGSCDAFWQWLQGDCHVAERPD